MSADQTITLEGLRDKVRRGEKIVFTTAYASWQAKLADEAGVDALIIGDSAAHVEDGYTSTVPMGLDEMLRRCTAVWRGTKRCFLVGDAPFGSTEESEAQAVRTAVAFVQHGCHAVKVEGASSTRIRQVRAMVDAGILVMGHVGLTPQTRAKFGGYKVQRDEDAIVDDACKLERAGVSLLLVEAVPPSIGSAMTREVAVPVIGVGAGPHVHGQTVILHDLLGLFRDFKPKFAKRYLEGSDLIRTALSEYAEEVRSRRFPAPEHCYKETEE